MRNLKSVSIMFIVSFFVVTSAACSPTAKPSPVNGKPPQQKPSAPRPTAVAARPTAAQPVVKKTPAPPPPRKSPKAPTNLPAELPEVQRSLDDTDSSVNAAEKRGNGGDTFLDSLYERPFSSQQMNYQPDVDITRVEFASDEEYFYFVIHLKRINPANKELNGVYGIEFDRTLNGRGDLMVQVRDPSDSWSIKNLVIYTDKNGDVGGPKPLIADEDFNTGNGYETKVEPKGLNAAYARVIAQDHPVLQFAISRSLLNEAQVFLWNAWADNGLKDVTAFDYNDSMGPSAAGSPMKDNEDYPVKDLFNLDNTCRIPYGFEYNQGSYPGMCIVLPEQKATPEINCYCNDPCVSGCCGQWVCE